MPQSKRHPARRPSRRPSKTGHRNPARTTPAPPPTSPARATLNRWSAGPLLIVHRLPSWLVPVLLAVLLVAGLAISAPAAGILLIVPALFLAWLLAVAWPVTSVGGRVLRLTVVTALLVAAVLKILGRI